MSVLECTYTIADIINIRATSSRSMSHHVKEEITVCILKVIVFCSDVLLVWALKHRALKRGERSSCPKENT